MNQPVITRRRALLSSAATAATLAGGPLALSACGGGGDGGTSNTSMRTLNLTSDLPSIDLLTDDTVRASGLATDTVSAYSDFGAASYSLRVRNAGAATNLFAGTYSLSADTKYTAVVWGRETALRVSTVPENSDNSTITTGGARLRVLNATVDSGALDVFITASGVDIADASPTLGAVTSGSLSGYRDISSGSFRLRVTGAGLPSDVRLDIPAIAIADKQHMTLILTAGASGVLVNATLLLMQGAATVSRNTQARVRVVAGANAGSGTVSATLGARTLTGALPSPSVGQYTQVDAGLQTLAVRLGGNPVATGSVTLTAGTDYTVLVYGAAGSAQYSLITDDNRLPNTTTRAKVRLVHGAEGADALTLLIDHEVIASDVPLGGASSPYVLNSTASARVDVSSPTAVGPVFSDSDVKLEAQHVYTVFVLGGGTAPAGLIRRER